MKKITAFLLKKIFFKKGIKVLKNKKGFSLLEVLIGVTIIGIVGAIALPRFANYQETAAVTAAVSTGKNVAKAYNLCTATKAVCGSMANLNISCETCKVAIDGASAFCVPMIQTISGKDFRSCVSISKGNGKITQTYGGQFKFCHQKCKNTTPGNCQNVGDVVTTGTLTKCDNNADCTADSGGNFDTPQCIARTSQTAGTCKSDGTCQ